MNAPAKAVWGEASRAPSCTSDIPKAGTDQASEPALSSTDQNSRWGELMRSAQAGDRKAYCILIGELEIWLRRYYSRRLPRDVIEDAVQEALLAAHAARNSYLPSRPFGPWISAIARYKWVDLVRAHTKFRFVELPHDLAVQDHSERVASKLLVQSLLGRLRPAEQEAIRLVKLEGDSVQSASQRTGQSEALVRVNVHRGIRKLAALVS